MRLLLLSVVLVSFALARPGISKVPPDLIGSYIYRFYDPSTRDLFRLADILPGNATKNDLQILKDVIEGHVRESERYFLNGMLVKAVTHSLEQVTLEELFQKLEDKWSTLDENKINNTKEIAERVFRKAYSKIRGIAPRDSVYSFIHQIFKAVPAVHPVDEVYGKVQEILAVKKASNEDDLRNLMCLHNNDFFCKNVADCVSSLIENNGKDLSCVIPSMTSDSFHSKIIPTIPPIATFGSKLEHFYNIFVVLRSEMDKNLKDQNLIPHFRNFFTEILPRIFEKVVIADSFDGLHTAIQNVEMEECQFGNISNSDIKKCYAFMQAFSELNTALPRILADANSFDQLAHTLYEGNIKDVETLPIVLKSIRKMVEAQDMSRHRELQQTFHQIRKLRQDENNETLTCDLKRYIRLNYLLMNLVDKESVNYQVDLDRLNCQRESAIVPVPDPDAMGCNETLSEIVALINNNTMTPEEKEIEVSAIWGRNDTPHYDAFKYIIYLRDLNENYYPSDYLFQHMVEYKNALWKELQRSCSLELNYENGKFPTLSVNNDQYFASYNWTFNVSDIYNVENLVKDRIYLENSGFLQAVFGRVSENYSLQKRIDRVISDLTYGPTSFMGRKSRPLATLFVLVNAFNSEIEQRFGEEMAGAVMKNFELFFGGIARRRIKLELDMERFGSVFEFVAELYKYREQMDAVVPYVKANLGLSGIPQSVVDKITAVVTSLTPKELEAVVNAIHNIDKSCEFVPLEIPSNNKTSAETENEYTTANPVVWNTKGEPSNSRWTPTTGKWRRESTTEGETTEYGNTSTPYDWRRVVSTDGETAKYGATTRSYDNYATTDGATAWNNRPTFTAAPSQCSCDKYTVVNKIDVCGLSSPSVVVQVNFPGNERKRRSVDQIDTLASALTHEIFGSDEEFKTKSVEELFEKIDGLSLED